MCAIINTTIHGDDGMAEYKHLLKARFSPKNGCFVESGTTLSVIPKPRTTLKPSISHHFVAVTDLKTKSKFGWVDEVSPFTLEDFIHRYHGDSRDPELLEHVKCMLDTADKLPSGTPVAADYVPRGISPRRMAFTVYRVIFLFRGRD
jgi:hypothetical protein